MTDDGSASTDTREGDEAAAGDADPEPDSKAEEDGEWRFALSDLEEANNEEEESNVAGPIATRGPLEPGAIDRENALFVLLGVLLVVGLLASIVIGF